MKLATKKIIAREFLFLLGVLIIIILSYLSLRLYNYYHEKQRSNLNNEISTLSIRDSLTNSYNIKIANQNNLYEKLKNDFDVGDDKNFWKRFCKLSNKDIIKNFWDIEWTKETKRILEREGFKDTSSILSFIRENSITSQEELSFITTSHQIKEIQKKLQKHNPIDINNIILYIIVLSISILFVVRHLLYGVKWSIKTLNSK